MFVWTTMLWALVIGWGGARVVWHLMSRPEYMGVPREESHELGARSARVSDAPSLPGQ